MHQYVGNWLRSAPDGSADTTPEAEVRDPSASTAPEAAASSDQGQRPNVPDANVPIASTVLEAAASSDQGPRWNDR